MERNGSGAERGGPISAFCCLSFHGRAVTVPSQQHWVHWAAGLKLWLCVSSPLGLGWAGTRLVVVWVWREQDGGTFVFTDIDIII